jgi:Tol biopolymer transport system component
VWVRDGVLLAQRIDFERRVLIGRATALVPRAGVGANGRGFFAASGRLVLAAAGGTSARELTWLDASGQPGTSIVEPGDYAQVRLSPDDRRIAVSALDPLLRTLDVFAASLDNPGRLARMSLSLGADSDPAWSPDSARVAYRSVQGGASQILTRALEPAAAPELPLPHTQPNETVTDWRNNGLLLQVPSASSGLDVWMLDAASGTRTQITRGGFNESGATWSPDASHVAYVSDESGQPEVYVVRWPGADRRVRVSFGGGTRPQWGREGDTLFFMRESRIMRTTTRVEGAELMFSTPETVRDAPGLVDFSIAHRSNRFAVLTRAAGSRNTVADAITGWMSLVPAPPPR